MFFFLFFVFVVVVFFYNNHAVTAINCKLNQQLQSVFFLSLGIVNLVTLDNICPLGGAVAPGLTLKHDRQDYIVMIK